MIPLSYAAILGGTCTLIGTSTNLIIQGFLLAQPGQRPLTLFEPAWVGVPSAIAGIVYILIMSPWLLPARTPVVEQLKRPREYTVEMIVDEDSPLAGKSVEHAGLRQLNGLYLVEIDRGGDVVPAAGPGELLRAGDRLVFAGITESDHGPAAHPRTHAGDESGVQARFAAPDARVHRGRRVGERSGGEQDSA
jgi:di/tricarboxylate transporter